MKKFLKGFLCVALIFVTTFMFVGCDYNNSKDKEYSQSVAQSIFASAYSKLISSEKVNIKVSENEIVDGVNSNNELAMEQTIVYRNGLRYYYVFDGLNKYVVGEYENANYWLDVNNHEANTYSTTSSVKPIALTMDLISRLDDTVEKIISGRYSDGVTYISMRAESDGETITGEIKIVDDNIVEMSSVVTSGNSTVTQTMKITYGDSVDVSVIPNSLEGYTKK